MNKISPRRADIFNWHGGKTESDGSLGKYLIDGLSKSGNRVEGNDSSVADDTGGTGDFFGPNLISNRWVKTLSILRKLYGTRPRIRSRVIKWGTSLLIFVAVIDRVRRLPGQDYLLYGENTFQPAGMRGSIHCP